MILALVAAACSSDDPVASGETGTAESSNDDNDGSDNGSDDNDDESGDDAPGVIPVSARTGTPTGELDSINWYTFYRPVFGLVSFQFADYPEAMVASNLCESLVRINPDFSLTPGLADWEVPDPTTYIYTIREGAAFWDGTPVTVDDVVFSLGLHSDPNFGSAYFGPHLNVESITAIDDSTVEINLISPDNTFTGAMAGPAGTVYQQAHVEASGAAWGTPDAGVLCSGPYQTGEWVPGESITLDRNDNYWNDDFEQLVGEITFVWPQDPAVIANAMNTGEIDGGWDIPPAAFPSLESGDAGTLTVGESGDAFQNFSLIVGSLEDGPIADVRVRQALSAAINREAIAQVVYGGAADPSFSVAADGLVSYSEDIFEAGLDGIRTEFDPGEAQSLVAEIGDFERPVVMAIPAGDSVGIEMSAAIEQAALDAGIPFEVLPLPADQYGGLFVDPAAREGIDLFFTIAFTNARDPLEALNATMGPTGTGNFNGYSNEAANALILEAQAETDLDARAELIVQIQDIFAADLPAIPVVQPRVRVFENDRLTGAPTNFVYLSYPWVADLGAS